MLGESFVSDTLNATNNGGTLSLNSANDTITLGLTSVTLGVSSTATDVYVASRGNTQTSNLYDDALETDSRGNNTETVTFTLGGLTAGNSYAVALYAGEFPNYGNTSLPGNQNAISFTINGSAGAVTGAPYDAPTMTPGVNYYETTTTADSSGNIVIVATSTEQYTPYNAISIESVQTVPEPSIWASLVCGLGLLAGFQAFRRHSVV